MRRLVVNRSIAITLLIFALSWVLWSGMWLPLVLSVGVLSALLVLALAVRIEFFHPSNYTLHLLPRLPIFWLWLLKEIVKANLAVARIIINPRLPISPRIITLDAADLPPAAQAVLANAITLTPGTLTLDVNHGHLEVHCLTAASAHDLAHSEILSRAQALARSGD